MIPSSKIAHRVLKQGFKPLFGRYKSLPRANIPPALISSKTGFRPLQMPLTRCRLPYYTLAYQSINMFMGKYIPARLHLYTSRYTLMYRGLNPSRGSAGHFDPLKMTDEIKNQVVKMAT